MGRPDGAHTHGHGGGGFDPGVLGVIALAVVVAAVVGPMVAALIHILIMVATVIGVTVLAGGGFLLWHSRHALAARAARPLTRPTVTALPADSPRGEIHLHFHGVDPAEVSGVIEAARYPATSPGQVRAAVVRRGDR